MSEGAAEGGGDAGTGALSDGQFGDVTGTGDVPVPGGQTAQQPGSGIFAYGFYPDHYAHNPFYPHDRPRRRKRRKRTR